MYTLLGQKETNDTVRTNVFWAVWSGLLLLAFILQGAGLLNTPLGYHHFIDQRANFGIENIMDVVSNLGFIIVGLWAIFPLNKIKNNSLSTIIIITGCILVGLGSAYYHLDPSDHRLLWDRIPMTIVFSGMFTYSMIELNLLPKKITEKTFAISYLLFSILSVLVWYTGTLVEKNWIGLYVFIQFGGMLMLLYLAGSAYSIKNKKLLNTILKVIFVYMLAKICEHFDGNIFHLTQEIISGHTIKHLLSAYALWIWISETKEKIKQ